MNKKDKTEFSRLLSRLSYTRYSEVLSQDNKPIRFTYTRKIMISNCLGNQILPSIFILVPIEILSDHKPLVWIKNKVPKMKLQRWRIKPSEYNLKIKYLEGKLKNFKINRE